MKIGLATALVVFVFLSSAHNELYCQTDKNSLYVEVGGSTIIGSVGYERTIKEFDRYSLSGTVGYLYWPFSSQGKRTIHGVPVGFRVYRHLKTLDVFGSMAYAFVSDREDYKVGNFGAITTTTRLNITSLSFGVKKRLSESGWFISASIQGSYIREASETGSTEGQAGLDTRFQPWAAIATGKSF